MTDYNTYNAYMLQYFQNPTNGFNEPLKINKRLGQSYPSSVSSFYDNCSDQDSFNTLESNVLQLPDEVLDSKLRICKDLAHNLLCLSKEREDLKNHSTYQIDLDILKCHNQLLEIERFYPGQNKAADQKRLSIEQKLFDLYHEKRAEETSCWRDQLLLKKDMTYLLREYLELQRKKELIENIFKDDSSLNPK